MSLINLDFKYMAAKNFLCFGPDGIEIDLKKYGNIVLIDGKNFDDVNENGRPGNNGSGKSSFADILTYTLFGKPVKRPKKLTHRDVIHNKIGKGLRVEVVFDNYRVIRCRKPDKLELFEEISGKWVRKELGGGPATQKEIQRIIGLNYETFINVMFFDDSNALSFLESDGPTKRIIVENLLSLERYRSFGKKASELAKDANNKIKFMATEYEHLLMESETYGRRVSEVEEQEKNWLQVKTLELMALEEDGEAFVIALLNTDDGEALYAYSEAQKRISELSLQLPVDEAKQTRLVEIIEGGRKKKNKVAYKYNGEVLKLQQIESEIVISKRKIEEYSDSLVDLDNLEVGSKCKVCYGEINSKSYVQVEIHYKKIISEESKKIEHNGLAIKEQKIKKETLETDIGKLMQVIKKAEDSLTALSKNIKLARAQIAIKSKLEKPETGIQAKVLEEQVLENRKQRANKKKEIEGPSPYVEIVKSTTEEHNDKIKECNKKKKRS